MSVIAPKAGFVEAKVVGGGKTMVFCEAQLRDHQGHVVAQALGTYRVQRYTHRADE